MTTYTLTTLATFNNTNGGSPEGKLLMDGAGNLYGTTANGGASNDGTVFELVKATGALQTLASFNFANGAYPTGDLVMDAAGDIFGTTSGGGKLEGGNNGDGVVFEFVKATGALQALVQFDAATTGAYPYGGLVADAAGNLYGTNATGSNATTDNGAVFEVARGSSTLTTLAMFDRTHGSYPSGGLIIDAAGNLYGTTETGGASDDGTVFVLGKGASVPQTLATFTGANGRTPIGALYADASGNLYGVTQSDGPSGDGTVFEIVKTTGGLQTLATFNATNGANPTGDLVVDSAGNVFGTTFRGGASGQGTVFEIVRSTGVLQTLVTFTGDNGAFPAGGLILDSAGNLYGTTEAGGPSSAGTVFELSPSISASSPTLISTNAAGQGGNAASTYPVYSPDGASVLFESSASNLVPGVSPSPGLLFIKTLSTGAVALVGSSASGVAGNGFDFFGENQQEFSADGSQVVFSSSSSNLVPGDANYANDVFVKNLGTGAVTLVSTGPQGQANAASGHAAFSPVAGDSRVLFESLATNLMAGASNGYDQIYLKNVTTGAVTLVSSTSAGVAGNGDSQYPVFTPDGTRAAFYSRANLSPGDTDSNNDIYLKNLTTGALSLLSVNAAGVKLDGNSFFPQFSPDGTKIAFFTSSTNAGFANPNGADELVVRDLTTGAITLVSAAADGTAANASSDAFAWSRDGTRIAFGSGASNLVGGDANGAYDVFVKTLATGAISLVSTGASGQGNGVSDRPSFSPDGSTLAFDSQATNFSTSDANGNAFDLFTVPLAAPPATGSLTTTLASSNSQGVEGNSASFAYSSGRIITADGASVLFVTDASNLSPNASYAQSDLVLKNTLTGAVTLVATNGAGLHPNASVPDGALDADGNLVVFETQATNIDPRATDGNSHIYVRNVSAGALTLLSPADYTIRNAVTGAGETASVSDIVTQPGISGDGRYVTASVAIGGGGYKPVVFDTLAHTAVDLSSTSRSFYSPYISQDGSTVVLTTLDAPPTGAPPADTDNTYDVYAYSLADGTFQLVSGTQGVNTPVVKGNGQSIADGASSDGSRVVFLSASTNLDDRDADGAFDAYVKDLNSGRLYLADVTADGSIKANASVSAAAISGDGNLVVFASAATNLVAGVADGQTHIYVKNLSTGAIALLINQGGGNGVGGALVQSGPFVSADGAHVVFASDQSNLVANDTNGATDVFLATLPAAPPSNTAPVIGGAVAGQAVTDKATVMPFSGVTVTDPDSGQTETVTVTYTAANGTLAGSGFTGSAGSATGTFASAAAAQAALRGLVFTPTANEVAPGQTVTTGFTLSVSDGTATATDSATSVVATSINDAPTLSGLPASQGAAAGAATTPFASVAIADPDTGQTETVTVSFAAGAGAFAGAGFSGSNGVYSGSFASAAAAQAALRGATFTPTAGMAASDTLTVAVQDAPNGAASPAMASTTLTVTTTAPANTAPSIGGAQAGQADAAGTPIAPFSTVTVTDPDSGQTETVTVSFDATHGSFSGSGFTGSGGVYTGSFSSAAAAQAALRGASFTPVAGQSTATRFTLSVSDGQATASDSNTTVVATYTAPSGGGSGGGGTGTPPSQLYGLTVEFQNLSRALAFGADANTPGTPLYAQYQAGKAIAAQLDAGAISLAQAELALVHLVDGTTSVAVASYAFFSGSTPTALGLNYLVHSTANPTDLNDAYYARFSTENRYINFAVNLATGSGAGAASFAASYGGLSLADATAKAYLAVFGTTADAAKVSALLTTLVPDGLGGQETRAQYFAQYGGDGPNGQGTKAAMVGFLLSNAVHDGSGIYGSADVHYLEALAHGTAPTGGSELALHYGPDPGLVGVTPLVDPTVAG